MGAMQQMAVSVSSGGAIPPPAITFVTSEAQTAADGSGGVSVTFDSTLDAGVSVLAFLSYEDSASIAASPTLIDGGTGTLAPSVQSIGAGLISELWYIHEVAGGETGLSFATDLAVRANLQVLVFSGLANEAAESTDTRATNEAAVRAGETDATSANNLTLALWAYESSASLYDSGPSDSFTRVGTGTGGGGGTDIWQECGYLIRPADHSIISQPSITISGAQETACCSAAFGGL